MNHKLRLTRHRKARFESDMSDARDRKREIHRKGRKRGVEVAKELQDRNQEGMWICSRRICNQATRRRSSERTLLRFCRPYTRALPLDSFETRGCGSLARDDSEITRPIANVEKTHPTATCEPTQCNPASFLFENSRCSESTR